MKHIKENCIACGVELTIDNWYPSRMRKRERNCITCHDIKRLERRIKQKGMTPRMLARLFQMKHNNDYSKIKEGFVYILTNPAWKDWIKVGMAVDANDRKNNYQTGSPYRDYKLYYKRFFQDRKAAEQTAHSIVSKISTERNGEWFKINKNDAKGIINAI